MASRPRTNLSSRRLGKYQLIARIGAGGMAEVFLARQFGVKGFNKLVVIKAIHEHLVRDPKFSDLLVEEARLAAQINHPNVVDIYEVGFEKGIYFIAMEYVRGHSLVQVVRKGRQHRKLDVYSVTKVIAEAARGLDAAHNHRSLTGEALEFVHRDVTLGNIIVSYEGAVKLVDFGVSKAKGRMLDVEGKVIAGKLGYAAPEQLRGETVDRRADIFGLGVTLWETLTHRRLLKAKTRAEALKAFETWQVEPPSRYRPETPAALDKICLRALEARPDRRYPSAAAMRRELTEMLRVANYHADSNALADYMDGVFADERRQLTERVFKALKNDGADTVKPALRVVAGRSLLSDPAPEPEPEPQLEAEPDLEDEDDDPTDIIDVSEIIAGGLITEDDEELEGEDTIADARVPDLGVIDPEVDAIVETSMAKLESKPTPKKGKGKKAGKNTREVALPPVAVKREAAKVKATGGDDDEFDDDRPSQISGVILAAKVSELAGVATPRDQTEIVAPIDAQKPRDTEVGTRRTRLQKLLWAACLTLGVVLAAIIILVIVRSDQPNPDRVAAAEPGEPPARELVATSRPAATPDAGVELSEPDAAVAVATPVDAAPVEPDAAPVAPDAAPEPAVTPDPPKPEPPKPQVKPEPPKRDRALAKRLYREGIRLSASGNSGAAKRKFREALKAHPGIAGAHRALGLIYEREGSKSRAVREYRRYVRMAPRARDAAAIKKRIERLR